LSRAAVDKSVDKVLTKEVFPESTCPRTPTLTFRTSSAGGGEEEFPLSSFDMMKNATVGRYYVGNVVDWLPNV
jgi:hypothetical protein